MTSIRFCKFHGFGNDYIVIERENISQGASLPDLAKNICQRHTGAGSDGIAVLERLDGGDADYFCEIVNPDGSIAGFSGNGTRCAAAYLYYNELWSGPDLALKTRSGVKKFYFIEEKGRAEFWFEAEIGSPKFAAADVPVITDGPADIVVNEPISVDGRDLQFSAVNVGNPVACIFVDDLAFEWRIIGRAMEGHERFPERCNIVFVNVIDRENIDILIWERGAGETAASGTCASGAAVLAAHLGKTGRKVSVHSEGGAAQVHWREDGEIVLTGRADLAYCGEWPD